LHAEANALTAQADAIGIDTYAILDDIARTYADATQDQYNAAARDALAAAIARSNQDGGSAAAQTAPAAEPAQDTGLTAPARADIEAQQEARDKAEREEAARQRAADNAASQDENRKRIAQASVRAAAEFELGQDPLDSLTGQQGMFDEAPQATASTPDAPAPQPITRADVTAAKQQAVTIQTKETDKGVAMFSRTPATKAAYEARIDALFAGEKAAGPNSGVRVLDRSDVLGLLGFGEGPVNLAEGKVIKGQTNHQRMTAEQWKKVPEWLDNPAAVFDSDTVPGALVLIAPETINGATVRMTVEPRKDGGADVHILSNAYDAPGFTPFARWFREGLGRLVDQKKFPAVLGDSGLQLSSSTWQNKPGMRNILPEKHLDGYRRKNSPAAMSRTVQPLRTPAATIRAAITKAYGKLLGQLESNGLVTLAQTQEQAIEAAARARADKTGQPLAEVRASLMGSVSNSVATDDLDIRRSANGSIQGFFDPQTGQSFLIADNLTAEAAPGVLMHEVGIHMAADGSMNALFNRAAMMLKLQRGNPFMKAVQARMDAAGETSGEEAAGSSLHSRGLRERPRQCACIGAALAG
jgi:hypothetical protein